MLIKKISVTEKMRPRNPNFLGSKPTFVPCIHLSGKYLQNLGFSIKDKVEIFSPSPGIIEIKKTTN